MAPDDGFKPGTDPFSAFWTELMGRMASGGMAPPSPTSDMFNQMRKVFFDALATQADQFMRSELFLNGMKQAMDNSLAWQQSMNQFLQKSLSSAQMPSRADSDHVVLLIRGMEERVLDKLEQLNRRVDRLEKQAAEVRT